MADKIKIAFLTTDNREQHERYDISEPYFGTAMSALLQGFAMMPNEVEVHVISCTKKEMNSPEKLADNIFFHQPLVTGLGWGRTAFAGCGLAVRKLLKTVKPHLTHAQGTERDCGVSMMVAPRGPRLLTIHGHMARIAEITNAAFPSYYWLAARLEAAAVRRADGVVSLTNYTRTRVAKSAKHTWVVPNAVDTAFFGIKNEPQPGLALCVAGIQPWKRQIELMQALDRLEPSRRPRMIFIGDTTTSEYGSAFSTALSQRSGWCEHVGPVGRDALRHWLAKASLLILPSIEDNCPMVILEAMAAGVPVAASRIGGIPDLVTEHITGRLFDPRQSEDIAQTVDSILSDRDLSLRMQLQSRLYAMENFHPHVIATRHLEIYRDLLGE